MSLLLSLKVAVRAVPYYEDFMKSLKKSEGISDQEVHQHIRTAIDALKANIDEINTFYAAKGLNFEETV